MAITRKLWCVKVAAIVVLSACTPSGVPENTNVEYREFTQCLVPSTLGPSCTIEEPGTSCVSAADLHFDRERQCYGTHWRLPNKYFIEDDFSPRRNLEKIYLSINIPEFTPGPRDRFAVYTQVEVRQTGTNWTSDLRYIANNGPTLVVKPTGEEINGMLVYSNQNSTIDYFIFVPRRASFMLYCQVGLEKNTIMRHSFITVKRN